MFDSVLIANRGEIAVRIIRACRQLRIRSVAVHSDADAGALHVRLADIAVRIGPSPARESYLDIDAVITAATQENVQAVHPGYGLLSENAEFARAVLNAGLCFIGPAPHIIATMGDKAAARAAAESSNVPVLPATNVLAGENDAAIGAERIGYPLLVKSVFGGGGRGMRTVFRPDELAPALRSAASEAGAAFGRSEVYLERYLQRPRHVEVQVLSDTHGTVLHLGDRDCSVQRRHQKLLEEAPAPLLADTVRARIARAAVDLATQTGYVGAGTVEFLVAPETEEFFFLEMNTRLQVEHGITELITGLDLVVEQFRIAAGAPLRFEQPDIALSGHAIQSRIAAEDPAQEFRPCPGIIYQIDVPGGPGVRSDFGVTSDDAVPREYDSLFGKLQAWGSDREHARLRLSGALDELAIVGIAHTGPYLRTVLDRPAFIEASHDTGSIEREWTPNPTAHISQPKGNALVRANQTTISGSDQQRSVREVTLRTDQGPVRVLVYGRATRPGTSEADQPSSEHVPACDTLALGEAVAPMDATVIKVAVDEGAQVSAHEVLVVLEAMKMELEITAPHEGTVRQILVTPGDAVATGALLISFDDPDV